MTPSRADSAPELQRELSHAYRVNLFTTPGDAETSARWMLRKGASYYVYRTSDGLFDWSAIREPKSPWFLTAVRVGEGVVS